MRRRRVEVSLLFDAVLVFVISLCRGVVVVDGVGSAG
jgi:hypothetical protein